MNLDTARGKTVGLVLTTIIAIRGNDFVIMCSDLQGTSRLTKEVVNKIRPIRLTELLGCAGSSEYIEIFQRYVMAELTKDAQPDYLGSLNTAIDKYGEYIANRIDKLRLDRLAGQNLDSYYPDAIFSCYDSYEKRFRIFEIRTPDPCSEISRFQSLTAIGSGGTAAVVVLKALENAMSGWPMEGGKTLNWDRFSWQTICRACHILLRQISMLDAYTSGFDFHMLASEGETGVSRKEYFPSDDATDQFPELLKGVIKEIGKGTVLKSLGQIRLEQVLKELGFG